MKYLILLRGLPGSGKSTWVKDNHLEDYTISSDAIRLLFSAPVVSSRQNYSQRVIPQKNDKQVWDLLHQLVENRIKNGQTTIVDATHLKANAINYYKNLCKNNKIRCVVIDFDVPVEEAIVRDLTREGTCHYVGAKVIRRMANGIEKVPSWCELGSTDDIAWQFNVVLNPVNYDEKYDEVVIFGDLHGCYDPLKKWFDEHPLSSKTKYVFVGDYEDRGIQHKELFAFLLKHRKDSNFKFLIGNHTNRLLQIANRDKDSKPYPEYERTLDQLNDFDPEELRKFIRDQEEMVYFKFNKSCFCVSHAGISCLPSLKLNSDEYIKGHGDYNQSEEVDLCFDKQVFDTFGTKEFVFQVHGHRNIHNSDIRVNDSCFNLEGGVEYGGDLRILQINKNGVYPHKIKNDVFRVKTTNEDVVNELKSSPLIRRTQNPNGISSYNFTKEAFFDKKWNELTCKARGLFVYDETDEVAARSYSKFFNLNEVKSSTVDYILNNWVGTVNVYGKANGYLGIISVDSRTNDFIFASKSRTDMDFAKNLKRIFYKVLSKSKQEVLKKILGKGISIHNGNPYSLVVEVIDPINDPHICKYDTTTLCLLDVFENIFTEKTLGYDLVKEIGDITELPVKSQLESIKDNKALAKALFDLHTTQEHCEGFVLEGHNKNGEIVRVKIKTPWYQMWKYYRSYGSFERKWDDMGFLTAKQRDYAGKLWKCADTLIDIKCGRMDKEVPSVDGNVNLSKLICKDLNDGWRLNIPYIIELVENYQL